MSKIQIRIIVFLFAVLTFASCWHIYRLEIYRQEMLSLERVRLGVETKDMPDVEYKLRRIRFLMDYDKQGAPQPAPPPPTDFQMMQFHSTPPPRGENR